MRDMLDGYALYVKLYGERNSGTNFVEELIQKNFAAQLLQSNNKIYQFLREAEPKLSHEMRGQFRSDLLDLDCARMRSSDFGWKHGCATQDAIRPSPHGDRTLFVCVIKHPVFWLKSLSRRPYNPIERPPKDFSKFIRYDWPLTSRDNVPGKERINIVELWNLKNRSYLGLKAVTDRVLVQRYEELLCKPLDFFRQIEIHLLKKVEDYKWEFSSTKGESENFEGYKAKYDLGNIADQCSKEDFDFIMERIDPAVMADLGYV